MKGKNSRRDKVAIATVGAWWLRNILLPAKAFQYGRDAKRDERNGFVYAAAMEWRSAAELLAPNALACEYCWRQWERIMRLPRLLAKPIGTSPFPVCTEAIFSNASSPLLGGWANSWIRFSVLLAAGSMSTQSPNPHPSPAPTS